MGPERGPVAVHPPGGGPTGTCLCPCLCPCRHGVMDFTLLDYPA